MKYDLSQARTLVMQIIEAGSFWAESVDATWQKRLESYDPSDELLGRKRAEEAVAAFINDNCETVVEGHKYRCKLHTDVQKLFYAPEFVHRYLCRIFFYFFSSILFFSSCKIFEIFCEEQKDIY